MGQDRAGDNSLGLVLLIPAPERGLSFWPGRRGVAGPQVIFKNPAGPQGLHPPFGGPQAENYLHTQLVVVLFG